MLAIILSAVGGAVLPAEPVQAPRLYRVGRVIIEGNDQTPDRVILEQLPERVRPGARLYHQDLVVGAERLRKCGFFPVNPWRGIGPTVEVLANELDSDFLDIRIRVNERPGNWLRAEVRQTLLAVALGDRIEVFFALLSFARSGYTFLGR